MKTRILLVNFGEKEKEAVSKLGVDADPRSGEIDTLLYELRPPVWRGA